jgi:sterol 3beta-glucosyltransferase
MKIGIQTWGSNGDVRPFLALADGLQKAGHQVTLVVTSVDNQNYQGMCDQLGIRYRQIPDHMTFDPEDFTKRLLRMNSLQWLRALLNETFFPFEQLMYEEAQALVAENDYVIGRHNLYPLKLAALQQNVPFFSVTFCHAAIPSGRFAPTGAPDIGRYFNPLYWKLMDVLYNWAFKQPFTRLWRSVGQTPPANVLTELLTSQQLNLVAADPLFCLGSEAWQSFHQICGFLEFTEDAQHWALPDSLQTFLDEGPAPVYMTLGSFQQSVPEWSMDLFLQAIDLAGCRAIIQSSADRYPSDSQTGNVYFIGKHPHQPVFKHCAAVVHHGGAGTTHAATRAGCPSIVIPFIGEQLFWGVRLQQLGLAVKPLPFKKVTAQALADAIDATLSTKGYRNRAQQASQTMQANHGVARAIELLQTRVGRKIPQAERNRPEDYERMRHIAQGKAQ